MAIHKHSLPPSQPSAARKGYTPFVPDTPFVSYSTTPPQNYTPDPDLLHQSGQAYSLERSVAALAANSRTRRIGRRTRADFSQGSQGQHS